MGLLFFSVTFGGALSATNNQTPGVGDLTGG
jgi:hypothetical protein